MDVRDLGAPNDAPAIGPIRRRHPYYGGQPCSVQTTFMQNRDLGKALRHNCLQSAWDRAPAIGESTGHPLPQFCRALRLRSARPGERGRGLTEGSGGPSLAGREG